MASLFVCENLLATKNDANSCYPSEFASSSAAVSWVFRHFSVDSVNRAALSFNIFTFMYLFTMGEVLIPAIFPSPAIQR